MATYGILQYFGVDPFLPAKSYHFGEGIWMIVRPPATMGHADYLANYLVFVVFAGAALESGDRILGASAAFLGSVAIVLSGTRGALAGLAAGALYWLAARRFRISRRLIVTTGAILAAAVLFYCSPAGVLLRSRVHWASEDPRGGARLWLWRDSLALAQQHWAVGSGPDTFSVEFPRFQSEELARAYPDFYYESPHNIFLDALTGQGLLGMAILAGLIVLAVWTAAGQPEPHQPALYLCAALIAQVVANLFTVFTAPTAMCFYLTLAMLVALRSESRAVRRRWTALPVSAALLIFAVRLLTADRSLALARRDLDARKFAQGMAEYEAARQHGVSADIWYSRSLSAAAQHSPDLQTSIKLRQQAMEAAERALRTADDPSNAYYNLASLYALNNDVAHTEASLRSAVIFAPNWFKPHWMLAQLLLLSGRVEEARVQADRAAYLDAGKNPEVARTADVAHHTVATK